jgi:hypothetical protein
MRADRLSMVDQGAARAAVITTLQTLVHQAEIITPTRLAAVHRVGQYKAAPDQTEQMETPRTLDPRAEVVPQITQGSGV